MDKLSLLKADQ